jgi:hypothetical protein
MHDVTMAHVNILNKAYSFICSDCYRAPADSDTCSYDIQHPRRRIRSGFHFVLRRHSLEVMDKIDAAANSGYL